MSNRIKTTSTENHSKYYDWRLIGNFDRYFDHKYSPFILSVFYSISILIIALVWHTIGDYYVETDFYWSYAPQAKSILNGIIVIDDFKGPGYPILLALGKIFIDDYFKVGILLSALSGGIVLFFLYRTIQRLFNGEIAFLVTVATMLNKIFVQYSYTASTDMVFSALILAAIYLLFKDDAFSIFSLLLAGIVSGYAYIVRYNGIALVVGFIFTFILFNAKQCPIKKRLSALGYYLLGFAIIWLPWSLFLLVKTGDVFYQKNYLNMAFEVYGKRHFQWDEWWTKEAGKFTSLTNVIFYDPFTFLQITILNIYNHLLEDIALLMDQWIGIFSFIAIFVVVFFKLSKKQYGVILFGFCYFIFLLPVFYGERFTLPLVGIYSLLAILFFSWRNISRFKIKGTSFTFIVMLILFLFSGINAVSYNVKNISSGPEEVINIVSDFKSRFGENKNDERVVARKPQIAYYLNMNYIAFPNVETIDDLIRECRKQNVGYLYYSGNEATLRPQFKKVFRGTIAPIGFKLVAISTRPVALLYKIDYEQIEQNNNSIIK